MRQAEKVSRAGGEAVGQPRLPCGARLGPAALDPTDFLKEFAPTVAVAMGFDPAVSCSLEVQVLRATPGALTLSVRSAEVERVVKHFSSHSLEGLSAYRRERYMLRILRGTGLVPSLVSHSDAARLLVMAKIKGRTLRDALLAGDAEGLCRSVGRWLADFAGASPGRDAHGSWADHLGRYQALAESPAIVGERSFLEMLPIERTVIAKNDGALANLLVSVDEQIVGIDFEQAAAKPLGWDLLLTGRALARLQPMEANGIAGWLAEGFAGRNTARAARWAALTRLFMAASMAEAVPTQNVPAPQRAEGS